MTGYFQSNRYLYIFWDNKLKEIKDRKIAPNNFLTRIGEERNEDGEIIKEGKDFFTILEERFKDTDKDWLKNLEKFVYQTCRTLYENATDNITPFPPTWKGLLNELPFDDTEYDSFVEEYSRVKEEVIDNYQYNLSEKKKRSEGRDIENNNLVVIFFSLLEIIGTKVREEDFPAGFKIEEEHKNLSRKVFFGRLRANLGGSTFLQVFKERNLLERKLIQFFEEDLLYLPNDWEKELIHKRGLGLAPADYGNIPTILNGKTLQELRTDSDNLVTVQGQLTTTQGNLTNAQNTITTAQTNLGITNLNALPNMRGKTVPQLLTDQQTITASGKTLTQLIADSNAHAGCGGGGCPNPTHHTNYSTLQTKSGEYDRIHTKLSGQVSDPELQVLLDAIPNCSHTDYSTRHTESQEYHRIHAKLSGKVSDSELQTLLDAIPTRSHFDYDNLKSENQTLKTENDQLKEHKCDCDSKVAQKEKEIINKIITDLELSTERERERERENISEAVIAEIKTKITPPDNSQLSQLQTQLKNKEAEVTELKKGNQSYLDLEKLVQQKQTENQALTTAKNELASQLNEEQKELLTQVLNKSAAVKEKVYKEEIIKSIESVLTSQGVDSQKFRQEITNLSSLTDIQQLSGKYSSQKLSEVEDGKKTAYSLNIVLGVLSVASLIALAYLLVKGFKKDIDKRMGDGK